MEVTSERQDGILSAWVSGRVDSANALEFEEVLRNAIEENDRAVVMDLEALSYISSAGLRAVLVTAKMLWSREAKFALCSLPAQIREVFETSGFDKVIALHPSRAEALASLDE